MKYNKKMFSEKIHTSNSIKTGFHFLDSKKAASAYIAWVLLMAFAVSLSTFVYYWMADHVESQAENIKVRADENLCELTAITATSFCQDDYSLIMNITNTRNTQVNAFVIQLFDIYDNPLELELNITLKPSQKEKITVLKHGTLAQADIIPVIEKDESIVCQSSKIVLNPIRIC